MRPLAVGIAGVYFSEAFFPENAIVFFSAVLIALGSIVLLGRRDGLFSAPLIVAGPLLVHVFAFPTFLRLGFLLVCAITVSLFFVDRTKRIRGAPVVLARLEFFLCAALFSAFAVSFAALGASAFFDALLLWFVAAVGVYALVALRIAAERARAVESPHVSMMLDAMITGFLVAEAFAVLSFLPLSPLTLAAGLTVLTWAAIAVLIAARIAQLTTRRIMRIFGTTGVLLVLLFASVPWFSLE